MYQWVWFSPHLVDHHEHDSLRDGVSDVLTDNGEIGVDKITNGLNLSLQLWINGLHLLIL